MGRVVSSAAIMPKVNKKGSRRAMAITQAQKVEWYSLTKVNLAVEP